MVTPKVSILTPAYNTGHLIHRLLESVLLQDYPLVEMIVVDDGSTDNTRQVVESFIPRFAARAQTLTAERPKLCQENAESGDTSPIPILTAAEWSLSCVSLPHKGQSNAINHGLKLVTGDYLIWPDSDDHFASPHALSRMVQTLADSGEAYTLVRCATNYLSDDCETLLRQTAVDDNFHREELFEDALTNQNHYMWGAGNYMCRMTDLRRVVPGLDIYTAPTAGQNWQLHLPLLYAGRCVSIDEPLYNIVERNMSHSRGFFQGFRELVSKNDIYESTVMATLDRIVTMPEEERIRYRRTVRRHFNYRRLLLSLRHQQHWAILRYYLLMGSERKSLRWLVSSYRKYRRQ